jgi:hypothetical protein
MQKKSSFSFSFSTRYYYKFILIYYWIDYGPFSLFNWEYRIHPIHANYSFAATLVGGLAFFSCEIRLEE